MQLSKLTVTAQNVSNASAIEQWAFFMLNAERLTMNDVQRMFADQEFTEAAGVLEMISKTPEQQMQYDARRKFQMDEAARFEQARNEGEAKGLREGLREGLQRGELLGRVRVFQELLGIAPSADELSNYDEARLSELADQLQCQLRRRTQ